MSQLGVRANDLWVRADLSAKPEEWARETVRRRVEQQNVQVEERQAQLLAELLAVDLRAAQAEDPRPISLYLLYPLAELPMICGVTLRTEIEHDRSVTLTDLVDSARLPEAMLEQPFFQEKFDTDAGQGVHIIQRYRAPRDAKTETIHEHEAFLWLLPDDHDVLLQIVISTDYVDLAAAAKWRPDLTVLAASFVMLPGRVERT